MSVFVFDDAMFLFFFFCVEKTKFLFTLLSLCNFFYKIHIYKKIARIK